MKIKVKVAPKEHQEFILKSDYIRLDDLLKNVGVVNTGEERGFVMADIPGLIEGASEGIGLGHEFLRHVDRCRLLVHVIDISGSEGRDPIDDFEKINAELAAFSEELTTRPQVVVGNKCDLCEEEDIAKYAEYFESKGYKFFPAMAAIAEGTADVIISLEPMEALRYLEYLKKDGWVVTSTVPFVNIPNYPAEEDINAHLKALPNCVSLNVEQLAKDAGAPLQAANMVLLGAAIPMLDIEFEKIEAGIRRIFARKGEEVIEKNLAAVRAGYENSIKK